MHELLSVSVSGYIWIRFCLVRYRIFTLFCEIDRLQVLDDCAIIGRSQDSIPTMQPASECQAQEE